MKAMLLEQYIRGLVNECVEDALLENMIREMVEEAILTEKKKSKKGEGEKKSEKESSKRSKGGKKSKSAKSSNNGFKKDTKDYASGQFIDLVNDKLIKKSQLSYKLFPHMTKGGARHALSAALDRERPIGRKRENKGIHLIQQAGG